MENHGDISSLQRAGRWGSISRDYGENGFCLFCGAVRDMTRERVLKRFFIHIRY